jgi:hypothetical protein
MYNEGGDARGGLKKEKEYPKVQVTGRTRARGPLKSKQRKAREGRGKRGLKKEKGISRMGF